MEINLELKCLETRETERIKLTVHDWENKCVRDLKATFQDEIEVPACDQTLFYQGRPLSDDLFSLKKLYFREGDWILVEFLAKANLAEMRELLNELKKFSEKIVGEDQSNLLTVSLKKLKDFTSWYVNHDHVAHALENLSFTYFIPWKDAKSLVHRHYFVQEGGFDAFMEILKFASKRYRMDDKPSSRHKFGKQKSKDAPDAEAHLTDLNNEQMILQMHCLSLLWNFSETAHDRRLVLQKGGLQLVIMALLLDPNEYTRSTDEFWEVASINETAVGCLVQYAEFSDCQEVIARNSETVNKLLCMVESQLCPSSHHEEFLSETFSKYSTQIAANTLFCCACGVQTPALLVQSSMHHRMINSTLPHLLEGNHNLALRYYCTLFLARIRSSHLVVLDSSTAKKIDSLIACFLAKYKPVDIATWEEKHNYVWVSLVPFISLAFTGRLHFEEEDVSTKQKDGCSVDELANSVEKTDGPSSRPFNYRTDVLGDKTPDERNAATASCYGHSGKSKVHLDSDGKVQEESVVKPVSCLVNSQAEASADDYDAELLGSVQTHKLGVFTLQHMLHSGENRQLLQAEKLLPYVDCLCWRIGPENGALLRKELLKHWPPEPPPLTVICKSVLAFNNGFEVVLKV